MLMGKPYTITRVSMGKRWISSVKKGAVPREGAVTADLLSVWFGVGTELCLHPDRRGRVVPEIGKVHKQYMGFQPLCTKPQKNFSRLMLPL